MERGVGKKRLWAWLECGGRAQSQGSEDLGRDPDSLGAAWDKPSVMGAPGIRSLTARLSLLVVPLK